MSARTSFGCLLLACMTLITSPAKSQASADRRGEFAMDMFFAICLLGKGDPSLPSQYPEYRLQELRPEAQAQFLNGRSGKVWAAKVSFGNFAVVITEGRECSVYVRRISQAEAVGRFVFTLRNFSRKETFEEQPPSTQNLPYGKVNTRSFAFVGESNSSQYVAVVSTSESEDAPMQAIFTAQTGK